MGNSAYQLQINVGMAGGDAAVSSLSSIVAGLNSATAAATAYAAATSSAASAAASVGASAASVQKVAGAQDGMASSAAAAAAAQSDVGDAAEGSSTNFRALSGALGKLGGPLGEAGSKAAGFASGLQKLGKVAGSAGPYVALAIVIVAVTTALIAGTVAIAKWAIGLADANRNQALSTEGLAASSKALKDLATILPTVQSATGASTDSLQKMAESLAAAGVPAERMQDALTKLGFATQGGASAEAIKALNAQLAAGGPLSAEMAASMAQWTAIAQKKMLGLDAQTEKFHANISSLFGGLNIEPLLQGFASLVSLFDANTASGKTMKFLFEAIFQPLIDGAVKAIPVLEAMFLKMEVLALKAYIGFKKLTGALDISGSTVGFYAVFGVLGFIIGVVAALGAICAAVFASIVVAVLFILAPVILVAAAIYGIVLAAEAIWDAMSSAGDAIAGAFNGALAYLQGIDLASIGSDMIMGLVNGITGAAGAVVSAITGAVGGAISAAESLLKIGSPSKVFHEMGGFTAAGFAGGVDDGAADAQSSLESMVSPPATSKGGAPGAAGANGKAGAGPAVSLTGPFNFYGVKDAENAKTLFEGMLTRVLEGDLSMLGGATT